MAQASAERLEHTGPAEKERVVSVPQRENSWQVRQSRLCQKEKEQSRLSRIPDHEGERVKVSESRTLAREHEEERLDSTVKEGRFQGGKGRQAKRASLDEVEGSMSG